MFKHETYLKWEITIENILNYVLMLDSVITEISKIYVKLM